MQKNHRLCIFRTGFDVGHLNAIHRYVFSRMQIFRVWSDFSHIFTYKVKNGSHKLSQVALQAIVLPKDSEVIPIEVQSKVTGGVGF